MGESIADAAATVRQITHPIRTAASPLLEPIPGLSELSKVLTGEDTSLLRLAEYEGLSSNFRSILEKLIIVDDIAGVLGGGNKVNLGKLDLGRRCRIGPQGACPDNIAAIQSLVRAVRRCARPR